MYTYYYGYGYGYGGGGYGWKIGTDGDDTLTGTERSYRYLYHSGNDFLGGLGGDDLLNGLSGDDFLDGGAGNDTLDGGLGNDTASYLHSDHAVVVNLEFGTSRATDLSIDDDDTLISIENVLGSAYNDHIQGSEDNNYLEGNYGNDALLGWGGDDKLYGGAGNDAIAGGDGNDTLMGGTENDFLQGNDGFDTADYSYSYQGMFVSLATGASHTRASLVTDVDSLYNIEGVIGTAYADFLQGDGLANRLDAAGGDDYLEGGAGNDTLLGGEGNDTMNGGAGGDHFDGGNGIDWVDYRDSANSVGIDLSISRGLLGDALGDTYTGMENIAGSDHFSGDVLTGNDVANIIRGLGGNDVIQGLGGNDSLTGDEGIDNLDGGTGRDTLWGGEGPDTLKGGSGFDLATYFDSDAAVTVDLAAGTGLGGHAEGDVLISVENVTGSYFDDALLGSGTRNRLLGEAGNDLLDGRGNDDILIAEQGDDTLLGGAGNDSLNSGVGKDVLDGGDGNDLLRGGGARDVLTGDIGNDTFQFVFLNDSGTTANSRDVITDFVKGEDKIDLSGIDADNIVIGDQGFLYIGHDAFAPNGNPYGSVGQLRSFFEGGNTIVEGDVTGDGVADFQIALNGTTELSALDFTL
jgi:Ca2+-binding RTX toxin-like protein